MSKLSHIALNTRRYLILCVLSISLAFSLNAQDDQSNDLDSLYNDFIKKADYYSENSLDSVYDILSNDLNSLSSSNNFEAIDLIHAHYYAKRNHIDRSERLNLIRSYAKEESKFKKFDASIKAKIYLLLLPEFRYNYALDSLNTYLDIIEDELEKVSEISEAELSWLYEKGRLAYQHNDYESALTFLSKAVSFLEEHFPEKERFKFLLLNGVGIQYRRLGRNQQAINHYTAIFDTLGPQLDSYDLTGSYLNNVGLNYMDMSDYDEAIKNMKSAVAYYEERVSPRHIEIGSGLDNISLCYKLLGKIDSSLYYSTSSYNFIKQNIGSQHPDLLLPLSTMAFSYLSLRKYPKAKNAIDEAYNLMKTLGWEKDDPSGNYFIENAFDILSAKLRFETAQYKITNKEEWLHKIQKTSDEFIATFDYAYSHLVSDLSRSLFHSRYHKSYTLCIDNLYTLYSITGDMAYLVNAFNISEKYKAIELYYAAQKDKVNEIPAYKKLSDQSRIIADSLQLLEEDLFFAKNQKDSLSIEKQLNDTKEKWILWNNQLKADHPEYYNLTHPNIELDLDSLRTGLRDTESIVSYYLADTSVYIFLINKDTSAFKKSDFEYDMDEAVSNFRNSIFNYFTSDNKSDSLYLANADQYAALSQELYRTLFKPIEPLPDSNIILIIDNVLGYLPFEAICSAVPDNKTAFKNYNYLLKNYTISYAYSSSMWVEMNNRKNENNSYFIGFAPSFAKQDNSDTSNLKPLEFNKDEINRISELFKSRNYVDGEATKENFINNAPSSGLIHLATHSIANNKESDYSFLAFENNERLFTSEVYALPLQAQLVTLSACETGLGELRSGEGVISIARAFSFAGAQSIISSLWSINDRSTSLIMADFYKNLKDKKQKDQALRKAKINYIQSMGHVEAHPFYWASFICIGDTSEIVHKSSIDLKWYILIALIIIFFFIYKKS